MSNHIPGPWKVTRAASGGISVDAVDPADGRGFELCEVWGVDRDRDAPKDDRARANASLIAAAPDLLEALQSLVKTMRSPPTGPNMTHEFDIGKAERAIIKALTGESK